MTKIEAQGRKGKDTGAWPGLQIRFQNKAPKGRKPLISLVKSRICGFHQKIGVTGFELGILCPINPVFIAFLYFHDKIHDNI
ncbi:hypothetical protein [uncultured Acetatifactor sp.]|uniref:hypothetical protein n=1 Tax=uncultured Acetatifactor sp. TaxID=1671927 RepID=UPI00262EB031|nr:hypothetical protein [uncultured Acetatifactor sp.]